MRVLTVRQPWAWAIVHGGKDVENRSRNIAGDYRGSVAIHAAQREAADRYERGGPTDQIRAITGVVPLLTLPSGLGAVLGVVNLWAVHQDRDNGNCCPHRPSGGPGGSPWSMRDHFHLCLTNPRALATPIPAKGRLGLWRPDADLEAAITAQLEERLS